MDGTSATMDASMSLPQHETLAFDVFGSDADPTPNDHDSYFSSPNGLGGMTAAAAAAHGSLRFLQSSSSPDGSDPADPAYPTDLTSTGLGLEPSNDVSGPLNTLVEIASNLLLFLLIFGMSATVDTKNLVKQLHNKFAILTGCAMQFLIMPLLGYLSILALQNFGLTANMGLTLLIVTASPGGSYSNWWCSLFNADLALSVTMTAISTILSVALLPANLMLYTYAAYGLSRDDEDSILNSVDFKTLFISLAVVILAIFTGLYASYKVHSHRFQRWANHLGSISGIALIVFSAVISTSSGGDSNTKLWGQHWSFYVGVAAPCIVGLVLANFFARLARLNKPEIVTVSVECCYQNVGIATSAAVAMFDDESARAEALCVPLFYGFVEAVVLGIYCVVAWKLGWTKAPRDEKLCVVLAKTYEVTDDDGNDDAAADSDADGESEGVEIEYLEAAEDGALGQRVVGPTVVMDLERGTSARSRGASTDGFSENSLPDTFSSGLLDRIVAYCTARKRRREHVQGLDADDVTVKRDNKDELSSSGNRARTKTEATVATEPSVSSHGLGQPSPTLDDELTLSSDGSVRHSPRIISARSLGSDVLTSTDLSLPTLKEPSESSQEDRSED